MGLIKWVLVRDKQLNKGRIPFVRAEVIQTIHCILLETRLIHSIYERPESQSARDLFSHDICTPHIR